MRLPSLTNRERNALREYVSALVKSLPELERIILFGSKARAKSRLSNSDTDVAVIIRGEKSPRLRTAVVDPTFDPILKYRVDISPLLLTARAFRGGSPLSTRIRREGIVLWRR